jgi:hypothetical protein
MNIKTHREIIYQIAKACKLPIRFFPQPKKRKVRKSYEKDSK